MSASKGDDDLWWQSDELSACVALVLAANGSSATDQPSGGLSKNQLKKAAKGILKPKPSKEEKVKEMSTKTDKKKEKPKKEEVVYEYKSIHPVGHKKETSTEFPGAYQPKYVEAAWQDWWEKAGYYTADVEQAKACPYEKKFVMVIPPPNVTGSLHLGHALTAAIQDTLTRWHRMRGDVTLYVPGTDHAGIATQSVVEKKLMKEEKISRHMLGREKFLEKVWQWKETYGNRITKQIRHMGSSVDWTREAFTMDAKLSKAVTEAFCRFHEDGLLYRDTRLVNWSCALKSAISDIEVDFIDLDGPTMLAVPNHPKQDKYEFGTLTEFAYKVHGSVDGEEVVVATTRLETMLGDTAVAVHPDDPRYKHLHGQHVVHPFNGRVIPIVLDQELVDMELGTGAVKITPAHDPNDYECGKRQGLEFINIFNEDGTMNANAAPFEGLMRYDARVEVEKALDAQGLLRGKTPNKMRLGICSRSGDIIEPYLCPQWYVNCSSMAERAVSAVRNGELRILPAVHEQTWYRWLENIRDWCISRQLWWGHRIPAYFATRKGETLDKNDQAHRDRWVVGRTPEAALAAASKLLGVSPSEVQLVQDEDVLDTWFSSGLFPFSVFGWPDRTTDMDAFYPTTLLETGLDILFFWVARMVMMGLHLTDQLPFRTVYLHAMVRDKYGRKMSKSLGNVIDPLEVIYGCPLEDLHNKLLEGNLPAKEIEKAKEAQKSDFPDGIPECGTDALRFGLLAYTVQGRDVNLDIKRVVGYRNFCNKLWNAMRFALPLISDLRPSSDMASQLLTSGKLAPRDRFILSRLNWAIKECNQSLEEYQFGNTVQVLYSFWLYDLCDVYLEAIKPVVYDQDTSKADARWAAQASLYTCLDMGLRLLHPLMPFVTEELWQRLPGRGTMGESESIMMAPYPAETTGWTDELLEQQMQAVKDAVHAARSLKTQYNLPNSVKASYFVCSANETLHQALTAQLDDIITLSRAGSCTTLLREEPPAGAAVLIVNDQCQVYIQLKGLVNCEAELDKLGKQMAKLDLQLGQLQAKMSIENYEERVPQNVRQSNTSKLEQLLAEKESVMLAIKNFKAI